MVDSFQKSFNKPLYYLSLYLFSLSIFLFDINVELGVASGVLYTLLVLFSLYPGKPFYIFVGASLGTALTVLGYFVSPNGGEDWKVLTNRGLALFVLWVTAGLSVAFQRGNEIIKDDAIHLANEARLLAVLNTSVDGIVTINHRGQIQSINPAAQKLFQYNESEILNKNVSLLMPEPWRSEHDEYLSKYLQTGETKIIGIGREVVGLRKDRTTFPLDLAVSRMEIDGQIMFTGILRDITERKASEKELKNLNSLLETSNAHLERLSYQDALTGVHNRRYFDEQLINEWSRCKRLGLPISLIMFDLDFFKKVNDDYGHPIGDQCLIDISRFVQSQLKRPGDILCRVGGEEFAILLPVTQLEGATQLAKQLGDSVRNLRLIPYDNDSSKVITISLGVATMIPNVQSVESLVEMADKALYQAKENGRDRYEIFDGVSPHSLNGLASVKAKKEPSENPQV